MILLSITGLLRMLLIILGVFILLRFIGRLMITKRTLDEQNRHRASEQESEEILEKAKRDIGKTTISKLGKSKLRDDDFVDFEEVD